MSTPSSQWTTTIRRIGDDGWDGEYIEVSPDGDGCQCIELSYRTKDGKDSGARITFPPDMAARMCAAIMGCATELLAERQEAAS